MSSFRKLCICVFSLLAVLFAAAGITLFKSTDTHNGFYRVEAKRLEHQIEDTGSLDISSYKYITGVYADNGGDLYSSDKPYVIIDANGSLYRVEYTRDDGSGQAIIILLFMAAVILLIGGIMLYIYLKIIRPFARLSELPREIAKGNLAPQIKQDKNRFLGEITWGMDMLRESVEESRKKELEIQKDKKLLLLSLSHDIKTPLSAIKLNAKALERGLYQDEEKRRSAARSIEDHTVEIEKYMSQITKAASEDFMEFEINETEGFIKPVIDRIRSRYSERLAASGTEFTIGRFDDILLSCDPDRLGECIQNLMENAIKYGDGKRISIDLEKVDGCMTITVSNTGCTLEESELTSIFDSFQRGSNAERIQGNGLGLFICRRLMSKMDGDIYAQIDNGCFRVVLVVKII